jgi:two-component system, NtrC family, sensor kinase
MQRRGEGGQPVKSQRARPKARDAPTGQESIDRSTEQFDRLKRERDEALEQLAATTEILRVIRASPTDAQPVFETIVRNAVALCGSLFANVFRFDGELLHWVASHNVVPSYVDMIREKYPMRPDSSQVAGRVLLTRSVVRLEDVLADPDYDKRFPRAMGWRRLLGVPMLREGEPIGVIVVGWAEAGPVPKTQEELLKTFAEQAVIAIENVRLFEAEQARTRELSESLEQQTATSEVLKVISSSPGELQPVFQAMLENGVRVCGAKFGVLFRYDGGLFQPTAMLDVPPAFAEFLMRQGAFAPQPGQLFGRLCESKSVIHVEDRATEPQNSPSARLAGARSAIAVPMLKADELVGAFFIYRTEVRPFTEKQIELVKNFAAQAVIAIENTRLLSELRESLQQQTATADVLKVISRSTFDLKSVLNTLIEAAARLCEADIGNMARPKEKDVYQVEAHYGQSAALYDEMTRTGLKVGKGSLIGRTALNRATVHILDVQKDPDYELHAALKLGDYHTMLGVPLLREGNLVGVIGLARQTVRPFTEKQIELVKTFADQAVIAIENARLFAEVQKRTEELTESLQQQTATADVLKIISSSPGDLKPVFEAMLANAMRICEAKFGHLLLYDSGSFHAAHLHDVPPSYREIWERGPIRPGPKVALGRLAHTKQVVQIPDIKADPAYAEGDPLRVATVDLAGARTLLAVPMLKENELVGAIVFYRQEVRPFTDKQIELVQNFASQAVIAIENARLLSELRESLQQQTATSDVLKVISSSLNDLKPVFETIGQRAEKLCDAEISAIAMVEGDQIRLVSINGVTEEGVEAVRRRYPIRRDAETVTARTIRSAAICHVPDVLNDPLYQSKDVARVSGFRGSLGVPMIRDGEVIGAIFVSRRRPGLFADSQVQLLRTFADQAVVAIENVRLFNETKEALAQQTATADVLKVISRSTFDLQTVLNALIESATRQCNADQGTITRKIGEAFFRSAAYGYSSEYTDYMRETPVQMDRGSVAGRTLVDGRIVHIADIKADSEYTFSPGLHLGNFRTAIGVPMLREGIPIGVLALTRKEVLPFSDKQIELATTFADQAAIAIENVRLFESVEARTRELAKSLEDLRTAQDRLVQTQKLASLGQLTAGIAHEIKNPLNFVNNFSGVSVELIDELRQALAGANLDSKLRAEISEIADTLQNNLDKVVQHGKRADAIVKNMLLHSREGSGEHRPVDINALVEDSLNLAYHGARAEKQGFTITLQRSLDPAAGEADVFPQDITRALLNLISNGFYAATRRRAEANGGYEPTLAAATKSLGDRVEITIRDNGTGIPPDVKAKIFNPFFTTKPAGEGTGLGLSISHDIIVKQHGGSIEVDTQPGEFTEIRVILPRVAALLAERY